VFLQKTRDNLFVQALKKHNYTNHKIIQQNNESQSNKQKREPVQKEQCQPVHPSFNLEDIFRPQTQSTTQQISEQIRCGDDSSSHSPRGR